MKNTYILNGIDIQELITDKGMRKASLDTRSGFLTQIKDFSVNDAKGTINPFGSGLLSDVAWRDTTVEQLDNDETTFNGTIRNLGLRKEGGLNTVIKAAEAMNVLLQFRVEETDIFDQDPVDGLSYFTVAEDCTIEENTVELENGTGTIPKPSFLSFGDQLSPRYEIIDSEESGSDTIKIYLDRGIEQSVLTGVKTRIAIPVVKTIPEAIRDALETAGLTKFDPSFNAFHAEEDSAGRYVWLNVRTEHEIPLSKHIDQLTEMGNFYLFLKTTGELGLIRGLTYETGAQTGIEIKDSEIISPYSIDTDDSKLLIGYSLLYINGNEVFPIEKDVSSSLLTEYKAKKRFKPVEPKSTNLQDYNYLYIDQDTAEYYGDQILDEFSKPRWILSTGMKGVLSENQVSRLDFDLGTRVNLSMKLGEGGTVNQEPVAVYAIDRNDRANKYNNIRFIFLNKPKGIARTEYELVRPSVTEWRGANNGVYIIFETLPAVDLNVQIYDYTGYIKEYFESFDTFTTVDSDHQSIYLNDVSIINGDWYYFQMWTSASAYKSTKTHIRAFKPIGGFIP